MKGKNQSGVAKRTHKKKLGKYYTPDWIVDFIVEHTLGPTLDEQPDRLLGEFTVLDPACGDGAFLLGVLRFLINRVSSNDEKEHRYALRSLVDCIYGVDVDPKAVQNCKKRLSIAASESLSVENNFNQRVLLGNSLLNEDDAADAVFGKTLAKMNPVDWQRFYPWVMRDGGFDVIVGNPPFIGIKGMDTKLKNYIRRKYRTVHKQFDILIPFIELGLRLLRPGGRLGFLISNKILAADYGAPLRKHIVSNFIIEKIID
ncbi:MAG: class I SAM-dependent DNA methyltransferase, partial [Promethearchaeota archaeon]